MKTIKLTHGSARVEDNIPKKTVDALDKISELLHTPEIGFTCIEVAEGKAQCKIQCPFCESV